MALRYWVGGTDTWNNVAGSKWSATSGGIGGASAPTTADDVFFNDKNAPNWAASTAYTLGQIRSPLATGNGFFYEVTTAGTSAATEPTWPIVVNNTVVDGGVTWTCRLATVTTAAGATCLSANFSGFIGTFNANTNWSVGTSLTFSSAMTITGTGNILKTASGGTWTFNTKTYTGGWNYHSAGGSVVTIADNIAFVGSLINGFNGAISGSSTRTISIGGTFSGLYNIANIDFVMNGTGSLQSTLFRNSGGTGSITINSPLGTINHNADLSLANMTFNYVQGNFISTSSITFSGFASSNIMNNVSTLVFNSMRFGGNGGQSVTLNSDMYVAGNLSTTNLAGVVNGTGRLYVRGDISTPVSGTATIEMDGTTNATITTGATSIANSLIINKSGTPTPATVTLNSFTWGGAGRTLQRTAGNINVGTSTVTIPNAAVTINNMVFNNLTVTSGATITQNTANTINGTLLLNGNTTFAGTAGWTCASLVMTAAGAFIMTLKNGVTYTTTTAVQLTGGTNTNRYTMISDNVSFRAIWTVGNTATQAITYVNGTRIDSSAGATVWTLGTVSTTAPDTRNWNNGSQPSTVGYTFVN